MNLLIMTNQFLLWRALYCIHMTLQSLMDLGLILKLFPIANFQMFLVTLNSLSDHLSSCEWATSIFFILIISHPAYFRRSGEARLYILFFCYLFFSLLHASSSFMGPRIKSIACQCICKFTHHKQIWLVVIGRSIRFGLFKTEMGIHCALWKHFKLNNSVNSIFTNDLNLIQ